MTKNDIAIAIQKDLWMMKILHAVGDLDLPDWWIGAGFVRSKIWDTLHGYKKRTPIPDIDVIYFDRNDFKRVEEKKNSTKQETEFENVLKQKMSDINWSVTNQARMHHFHNDRPYNTSEEGLAQWIETATCIGVKLDPKGKLILCAPHGISDLVRLILRPTRKDYIKSGIFDKRITKKKWLVKWPKLTVVTRTCIG